MERWDQFTSERWDQFRHLVDDQWRYELISDYIAV